MKRELELVMDAKATLGEGPHWDYQNSVLYWVDINEHKVHVYNPADKSNRFFPIGQSVGAVVPRKAGGLILALHHGFYEFDPKTELLQPISDPEQHLPDNRFNDGKCDPAGRFWAGTMSFNEEDQAGSLYCLDTNLRVRAVISGVTVSNGLAWSLDHKTMYFIDSPTKRVIAYDYRLADGEISNPRTVIVIPDGEGVPDGMTIDAEGKLWIAQWGGYKVSRWDPDNGERIDSIGLPVAKVTSCTFGGEQLDELYITSARVGLTESELQQQPLAGGVFRIRPGVRGLAANVFGG